MIMHVYVLTLIPTPSAALSLTSPQFLLFEKTVLHKSDGLVDMSDSASKSDGLVDM